MLSKKWVHAAATAATLAVCCLYTSEALAATVTSNNFCTLADVTAGGSNADGCFGRTTNSNNDNLADFNNDEFVTEQPVDSPGPGLFGFTDWVLFGKNDNGPQSGPNNVYYTGQGTTGGDWSVDPGAFDSVLRFLVVIKAGNSWAAYLFEALPLSENGTWSTTAFPNPNNTNLQNVSHISIYTSSAPIPVPAAGLLLLTAVGGICVVSRRRKPERRV